MFRSHFRGLKWIIIWYIPLFLLLSVVLLVFSVFAKFKFISLNHKIRRCFWGPRGSRKIAKEAQNNQTEPRSMRTRTSTKRRVRGAGVHDQAGATTGSPRSSPWPVVVDARSCCLGCTTVHPLYSWVVSFSFMPFSLPTWFVDFACYFTFKVNVFGSVYTPNSIHTPFTIILVFTID